MCERCLPEAVVKAIALDDVQVLLRYWDEEMHPIPDDEWGPDHPMFSALCLVAYAIEDIGEALMTEEQRLATLIRSSFFNPALPLARA